MLERDLLFRELTSINSEFKAPERDYFVDAGLNNNSKAIIEEAAVKPFNQEDKAFLYTDLLPDKPVSKKIKGKTVVLPSIESSVKKNNSKVKSNQILGIDVQIFLDRLQKYVDFQSVEQALTTKYPKMVIDKKKALNEIVAEAVHQFQAKIFIDPTQWDGIINPSTVSSLGFVFHQGKNFNSKDANPTIKKAFQNIDKHIKDYVANLSIALPDITGRNWFDFIIDPSIYGWKGKKGFGFHLLLTLKLREIENELLTSLAPELTALFDKEISATHGFKTKTYGQVPRLLGKALKIEEPHGDIRKVSDDTPLSRHLSGMAIDINKIGNPWVRGAQGLTIINKALNAAKKTLINTRTFKTAQVYFADLAQNDTTAAIFDKLKEQSDDCLNFLNQRSVNWGKSSRTPNSGFLNLRKELVVGLRDKAGLAWGALDLGPGKAGNGVKEFQIYAKMPQIAHKPVGAIRKIIMKSKSLLDSPVYGDDFWEVPNTDKYTGEVNGVANSEVRKLIKKWKENSWYIPVVVQAWTIKSGKRDKIFDKKDNIWKYNEVKSTAPRMFVRDFSGYYTFPSTRDANDLNVLGDYGKYGSWGGPRSEGATKSWSETEITPNSLLKKSLSALSASERSTFIVIRAVSEVECEGHLDRMNAYDNAFVSFGPFHLVLGLSRGSKVVDGGEISSYIAYLKIKDKAAYDKAFGFFGLDADKSWGTSGQDFFYSGGIRNYGKGRPAMKRGTATLTMNNDKEGFGIGNYLRSWHWFYRFVMAARTVPGFTQYIWDFARIRIRDISSTAIQSMGFTNNSGKSQDPTIAQIFTSECAMALVLRLHVRYPRHVADLNSQDEGLKNILDNSLRQMKKEKLETKKFAQWGERHQEILIENTINNYSPSKGITTTLKTVRDFTFSGNALSTAANSFSFDSGNLPPAPTY